MVRIHEKYRQYGDRRAARSSWIGYLAAALLAIGCSAAPETVAIGDGGSLPADSVDVRPAGTATEAIRATSPPSVWPAGDSADQSLPSPHDPPPAAAAATTSTQSGEASLPHPADALHGSTQPIDPPAGEMPPTPNTTGAPWSPDTAGQLQEAPGGVGEAGPIPLVLSWEGAAPPPEEAAQILSSYLAFWDSYWAAAAHPVDPQHPGLARHATEPVRSRAIAVLTGRAAQGLALRLPPDHGRGRVVHVDGWDDGGQAEVIDCFVDTAVLYEVSTGRVRNDEQATVIHLALMRRENGAWRVAEVFEQAVHIGRTDGCTTQTDDHITPHEPAPRGARDTAPGTYR